MTSYSTVTQNNTDSDTMIWTWLPFHYTQLTCSSVLSTSFSVSSNVSSRMADDAWIGEFLSLIGLWYIMGLIPFLIPCITKSLEFSVTEFLKEILLEHFRRILAGFVVPQLQVIYLLKASLNVLLKSVQTRGFTPEEMYPIQTNISMSF